MTDQPTYKTLCSQAADDQIAQHLARALTAWRIHLDDEATAAVDAACDLLREGRGAETFVDLAPPTDTDVGDVYRRLQSLDDVDRVGQYVISAACCALEWPQARKVAPAVWPVVDNLRAAMYAWLHRQSGEAASPWSTKAMDWREAVFSAVNVEAMLSADLKAAQTGD